MRIKRFLAMGVAFAMLFAFGGCRSNNVDNNPSSSEPNVTEQNELVIYHNADRLTPQLTSLVNAYSQATGRKVSLKHSGGDFMNEVTNQKAAIYIVDSREDLSPWFGKGLFGDITTGLGEAFNVHPGLHFNNTGLGNYGIPLMLEGYGYIVDKTMLEDLFAGSAEALIHDLARCSYTDFEGFVDAVDTYIASPSAATVTVNGSKYTFAAEKTGKAQSLTGVFAMNYESHDASEYLLSYMLAAKFGSHHEVMTAAEETVTGLENSFSAFIDVLDLHTGRIAGPKGTIGRGDEFIGGDYNYSAAVDAFTRGYALFYPGSTGDAMDFETSAAGFGANLDIIPMKLPLAEDEITASGQTLEKLQRSIVIGSRYYIAMNPEAEETHAAAARDFVKWVYSEEAGMKAYTSALGGLPFNYAYGNENGAANGTNGNENGVNGNENTAGENGVNGNNGAPANGNPSGHANSGTNENGTTSAAGKAGRNAAGISETNPGATPAPGNTSGAPENGATENQSGNSGVTNGNGAAGNVNGANAGRNPNYNITDNLTAAVARYYAEGNWIPALTRALPGDWLENSFGKGLTEFWGKESWSTEDRAGLTERFIGGWKERLGTAGAPGAETRGRRGGY